MAGRPIVYLYEDSHRLQDPRIHPLILNSGYIHYPIGRTDRHGAGQTLENLKENCFKPEIFLEKTRQKENEGSIEGTPVGECLQNRSDKAQEQYVRIISK